MDAWIVDEVRPYRLIEGEAGRRAVVEARCGHLCCLGSDRQQHVAPDTAEGMVAFVGKQSWAECAEAVALFRQVVEKEGRNSESMW